MGGWGWGGGGEGRRFSEGARLLAPRPERELLMRSRHCCSRDGMSRAPRLVNGMTVCRWKGKSELRESAVDMDVEGGPEVRDDGARCSGGGTSGDFHPGDFQSGCGGDGAEAAGSSAGRGGGEAER